MILQSYQSAQRVERGTQRAVADGPFVQWRRPGRAAVQDSDLVLGWSSMPASTVRAIDLHFRIHRLDRFELVLTDGSTTQWFGYAGAPVVTPSSPALFDIEVTLTSFPR